MARSITDKDEPKGKGHNSGDLSKDDRAALQLYHSLKIKGLKAEHAEAAAAAKVKLKAVNQQFALVKGELGYQRNRFEEIIALSEMPEDEFRAHEAERREMMENQGLPIGAQMELALGDAADDLAKAEADGYRAGKRADDPCPPGRISPVFHPNWMEQWHRGQAENALMLIRADEIIEARALARASEDEGAGEDDDTDRDEKGDDADPDEDAARLRASGFMQTDAEPKPVESYDPLVFNGMRFPNKTRAAEAKRLFEEKAARRRAEADEPELEGAA